MSRKAAILVLLVLYQTTFAQSSHIVSCDQVFCECSTRPRTTVNCTVSNQNLELRPGVLPNSTSELIVEGANAVTFHPQSLSGLSDSISSLFIHIADTKEIHLKGFTASDLKVYSVYLEIRNCETLRIENKTFNNIGGSLSVTITNCDYVSIGSEAFSWLLRISIGDVRQLDINAGAFVLDSKAHNMVTRHGPAMTIELRNLSIPELAEKTFGWSAANISFEFVKVNNIRTNAFSANTYSMITAVNSTFDLIEQEAFGPETYILNLQFHKCRINKLQSNALQSAIGQMKISHSRFAKIETDAINATVARIEISNTIFNKFSDRGFVFSSCNVIKMESNSFDDLPPNAIVLTASQLGQEVIFNYNEIEKAEINSLSFLGITQASSSANIVYKRNYFGQRCHCNISSWLGEVMQTKEIDSFKVESYCTVEDIFAICFNVPEQNMVFKKFLDEVCGKKPTIKCEKKSNATKEIMNPRFPHKREDEEGLSDHDKKVIGIVIVTILGCVIIAMFISLVKWMRQRGYCVQVKNFLFASNSTCGALCERFCACRNRNDIDHARSISQLSVNEYTEIHRLNEPRVPENIAPTTALPNMYTAVHETTEDKTTQTLPEELTKELLDNLKEKLEDPDNYVEAREMIEHLYELIKVEESCNTNTPKALKNTEESIYELPFQNTTPRIGKNKVKMISIGTRTPSIEKLTPLSPYNRKTALAHEYFEPKDFAVHLYAEIANSDERKTLMNAIPDVLSEQIIPRGPYLCAVREKGHLTPNNPVRKRGNDYTPSPQHTSTIKSNKSTLSNSSSKMANRPLPKKPEMLDPGEGTSFKNT